MAYKYNVTSNINIGSYLSVLGYFATYLGTWAGVYTTVGSTLVGRPAGRQTGTKQIINQSGVGYSGKLP